MQNRNESLDFVVKQSVIANALVGGRVGRRRAEVLLDTRNEAPGERAEAAVEGNVKKRARDGVLLQRGAREEQSQRT